MAAALLCAAIITPQAGAYDYPVKDPYAATVVGTPSEYEAPLPEKIDYEMLGVKVFPERRIPSVFWYQRELLYTLSYQKNEAPLIFVIAGTGSTFYSPNMIMLQRAFYGAGFHVVCLPSPTQMNFITAASRTGVPGNIVEDAEDLYRVMTAIHRQIEDRIKISGFYLAGYSLGASQSAFVSKLDEERRAFNFKKVLMLNPAVSLYTSAKILDDMILQALPGGQESFDPWFHGMLAGFAKSYKMLKAPPLDHDFLYDTYRMTMKTQGYVKRENMAGLIGTSFRMSSQNMIFAADVMSNYGYVVPKNHEWGSGESLTDYMKVLGGVSFLDYFNEFFYPYYKSTDPVLTKESLIEKLSLHSIKGYLQNTPKILLIGNEDDLILAPEDLAFLKSVFGARAKLYPFGGHCGNMGYAANVAYMLDAIKN